MIITVLFKVSFLMMTYYIYITITIRIKIKLILHMQTNRNNQDDGCFEEEELQQEVRERHEIQVGEANPIYTKPVSLQPQITIKLLQLQKPDFVTNYIPFRLSNKQEMKTLRSQQQNAYNHLLSFQSPFTSHYDSDQLVYQKYNNQVFNKFKDIRYYAGFFIPKNLIYDNIKQNSISLYSVCQQYPDKPTKTARTSKRIQNLLPQHREQQLIFDSNFQSGNLFAAFRTNRYSYDLVMQNDINSKGSNQWFYFSVQKMLQNVEYTFNIVNFTKRDSLFNYGMKPAYYSTAANKRNGQGWFRFGENVSYFRGEINRENSMRYYYCLKFTIKNKFSNDKIYLAHSYPYTYTKLNNFLGDILKPQNNTNNCITKFSIGTTISGRNIIALKICENKKKQNKKSIIILARQHPGQTQGSYVCEGVIQKLLEKSANKKQKQGQFLRKNYIIYVIPMVNIDGVIFGHYRANLAGKDLNRKWDSTDKEWVCPQVAAIKKFIAQIASETPVRFILDLHGHSKKLGSFFYGNPCADNPQIVRIYPYICSRMNTAVQFMECTFHVDQSKRKAARVYLSHIHRQLHVYTFESSFYGYMKNQKTVQFTPQQYSNLGETLVQGLYIQLQNDNKAIGNKKTIQNPQQDIDKQNDTQNEQKNPPLTANVLYKKFFNQLKNDQILLGIGVNDQSGSQSNPQQGQINNAEVALSTKTKQLKEIKQDPRTCQKVSKSIIRVSHKKNNTVEYKQITKPSRNIRFLALSQVNAVLPDKYHISLQPLQRRTILKTLMVSVQCQTQKNQKLPIKSFKLFEIAEKDNLYGQPDSMRRTSHSKRHSQLMSSIQKNQIFRTDLANEEPLIRRRERSLRKNGRTLFTQTILSYKNTFFNPVQKQAEKKPIKMGSENEARIAKMQQINLQVLKVYSRRSAIVDIGLKTKDKQKSINRISYISSGKKRQSYHI